MTSQLESRAQAPATAVARQPGTRHRRAAGTPGGRWQMRLLQVAAVVGFFALWELFALTPTAAKADMPGALESIGRLGELVLTGKYWAALASTTGSWAVALAASIVIGVPAGLAIGRSRRILDSTKWSIDFLRTIPSVAFIPLALLLMGRTQAMVIVVAVIPAVWPLVIQAIYAGQQADPVLGRVARSFRLTVADRIRYVLAPDVLAFVWPGLRLATTAALLVTVSAELIGGSKGIGSEIMNAQIYNRSATLYAWVLTACFLGLLINAVLAVLQRKLLWWHPSMRGKQR
ncbi:ABC transporter permease [Arthrobacter sp. GCM10027362]|uniref:ABC transporter permease n=1 Tax=Arthrobacter sp. GCM10027362 TaxID=3273379 RepID=UPI003644B7C7